MTSIVRWGASALAVGAAVALAAGAATSQPLDLAIPYGSGQNVAPVYEGWERNPDGSIDMVFGYMNRNYDERPEIPIGKNNHFAPEPIDRGQPTHFYPRRQQFMFKVRLPKGFDQPLIWTLTRDGKSERAVGKLDLEWELSQVVYSQNRRGLGSDAAVMPPNDPPTVSIEGPAQLTTTVGSTLMLTAKAGDDGVPKPPPPPKTEPESAEKKEPPPLLLIRQSGPVQQQIIKPNRDGLSVTWTQWRGPGRLSFDPMQVLVKDGQASTAVTFSEPGTYVIRAYADDGVVFTPADVTVKVADKAGRTGQP